MVPGFGQELMSKGCQNESHTKMKKFMTMMDSMTNEGLSLCPLLYWFFGDGAVMDLAALI
jgi:signal recognition particle GTPase